jgi:hypothetical protein
MDDVSAMGVLQSSSDANSHFKRTVSIEPVNCPQDLPQWRPSHILHHEVLIRSVFTNVEHLNDVLRCEPKHDARFAPESFDIAGITCKVTMKKLDGDDLSVTTVDGFVYGAHCTGTDLPEQFVASGQ